MAHYRHHTDVPTVRSTCCHFTCSTNASGSDMQKYARAFDCSPRAHTTASTSPCAIKYLLFFPFSSAERRGSPAVEEGNFFFLSIKNRSLGSSLGGSGLAGARHKLLVWSMTICPRNLYFWLVEDHQTIPLYCPVGDARLAHELLLTARAAAASCPVRHVAAAGRWSRSSRPSLCDCPPQDAQLDGLTLPIT